MSPSPRPPGLRTPAPVTMCARRLPRTRTHVTAWIRPRSAPRRARCRDVRETVDPTSPDRRHPAILRRCGNRSVSPSRAGMNLFATVRSELYPDLRCFRSEPRKGSAVTPGPVSTAGATPASRSVREARSAPRTGPPPAGNEATVFPQPAVSSAAGRPTQHPCKRSRKDRARAHGRAHGHTPGARGETPAGAPARAAGAVRTGRRTRSGARVRAGRRVGAGRQRALLHAHRATVRGFRTAARKPPRRSPRRARTGSPPSPPSPLFSSALLPLFPHSSFARRSPPARPCRPFGPSRRSAPRCPPRVAGTDNNPAIRTSGP